MVVAAKVTMLPIFKGWKNLDLAEIEPSAVSCASFAYPSDARFCVRVSQSSVLLTILPKIKDYKIYIRFIEYK